MKKNRLILLLLALTLFNCSKFNKQEIIEGKVKSESETKIETETEILKNIPIVQVDMDIFNKNIKESTELVGNLIEDNIDISSTTVNYFKIDNFDNSNLKLSEDKSPLKIIDYGPVGKLPEEMQKPSIYIMFSKPMVPLSKLGEPLKEFKGLTIDPPLKGIYRWYGSKLLSFEVENPLLADKDGYAKEYYVTASKDIKSLGGTQLNENYSFSFYTKEIQMVNLYIPTKDGGSFGQTRNVPFDLAKKCVVRFNMPIDIDTIKSGIEVKIDGIEQKVKFSRPIESNSSREGRSLLITLPNEAVISNDNRITVSLLKGTKPREGTPATTTLQSKHYTTLVPFRFENSSTYSYSVPRSPKGNRYPLYLNFTQNIDPNQDFSNIISSDLEIDISENVNAYGRVLQITNLPVEAGDSYSITISDQIKDIYGQKLSHESIIENVKVPQASSYIRFPDKSYGSGNNIRVGYLESQFTPGLILQHQNINSLNYAVLEQNGVLNPSINIPLKNIDITNSRKNHANFEFIDLKDKLNSSGNGTVYFKGEAAYTRRDNSRTVKDNLVVQVTDIGITVRYGYNKILVWANSLKDGSPVKNAQVKLYNVNKKNTYTLTSDSDGLAVFELKPGEYISSYFSSSYKKSFWVSVETDRDKAELQVFNNQSPYRWAVNGNSPKLAERSNSRVLLFSDRKLYKPGEEVSFRGIHWKQKLGEFTPYSGVYNLELKTTGYRGKVISSHSGRVSESGGFYGSFKLPDDIKPGNYYLTYGRDNQFSTIIKIAHFRRLNFAVQSKVPNRTFFTGDTISIPVNAYYLAGGAMPGADYSYFWTRKLTSFKPKGERWKSYVFGLRNYSAEKTMDRGEGKLSSSGEVHIKQVASEHERVGGTYRYVLETTVTDIDNQQISSTASTLVHPSSYYIGAKLGNNSSSYWSRFIKAKESTQVNLALVTPDGETYNKDSDIQVDIYKVSWKSSYQQGVYDRVNISRRRSEELVETLKTRVDSKGFGEVEITPESSGSYILRIHGADRDGRRVQTELTYYAFGGGWYYWGGDSDKINLVPDKDLYFIGDKARIMVQSPLKKGKYLLTVEREGIVKESVLNLDEETTMIDIPIEEGYVPRIYVALSSFTNRKETPSSYFENDLGKPKNLFGLTALNVSTDTRSMDIEVVSSKENYLPGDEAEVYIKVTKNGLPVEGAELMYLAVDRGVVDLINYHVPNPIKYFYNPNFFPLHTNGDDLRNYLMDPVSYDISNLQGGDGKKLEERKDFNPLAAFEPYLITDKNGIAKVKYKLPDTLTTYRSTAIALNGDNIGYKENEILVKNPINVRTAFPRRLRFRDTGVADVVVQNNTDKDQKVLLTLTSDKISTPGDNKKEITVPAGSIYKVPFILIPTTPGTFEVTVLVESEVLNEKLIQELIIERPLAKEAFATTGKVDTPITDSNILYAEEGLIIPRKVTPGFGSYSLDIYASRLGMLKAPINGLKSYRYDTLSQRLYRYFPDAILGDSMEALGFSYNKAAVSRVLKELKSKQTSSGWTKYWSKQQRINSYMDTLALLFTLQAKDQGVKLPKGLESGLSKALLNDLNRANEYDSGSIFTTYVLNLAGKNVEQYVEKLLLKKDSLGLTGYGLLTLTLSDMDRKRDAKSTFKRVKNFVRQGTRTVDINETYERRWYFDSEIRQISTLAWAGLTVGENKEVLQKYLNTLKNRFNSEPWRSRTDYLWSVLAMKVFAEEDTIKSLDMQAKVFLNNSEIESKQIKSLQDSNLKVKLPIYEEPISNLKKDVLHPVRIEKSGKGNLYYSAQIEYALPSEIALARDEGIGVFLEYETLSGEKVEPKDIVSGTTYRVRVVISSNRRRSYLTLDVPVPSGIEILDPSFATTSSYMPEGGIQDENWTRETVYGDEETFVEEGYGYYSRHFGSFWWYWKNEPDQEIYDNHITYTWDTFYQGKRELTFLVRATSQGIYPTPPAQANLLFEPEVFGRTSGELFVIQ